MQISLPLIVGAFVAAVLVPSIARADPNAAPEAATKAPTTAKLFAIVYEPGPVWKRGLNPRVIANRSSKDALSDPPHAVQRGSLTTSTSHCSIRAVTKDLCNHQFVDAVPRYIVWGKTEVVKEVVPWRRGVVIRATKRGRDHVVQIPE